VEGYVMAPGFGGGVCAADFDNDGDIDLFLPTSEGAPNLLFRNRGDGVFDEIAAQVGLASTDRARVALWIDYDGDGLLDLLVGGDCRSMTPDNCLGSGLRLYRQSTDGSFVDVTTQSGVGALGPMLNNNIHRGGLAAGDLNADGFLDVVQCLWGGGGVSIFLNTGAGEFVDATADSGVGSPFEDAWQPVLLDVDHDGDLDFYTSIDFGPNHLWINDGSAHFLDAAPRAHVDTAFNDMGIAVGDADNDGELDLYISEINEGELHNVLHHRLPGANPAYEEIAVDAGVADASFAWGDTWFDADNDGFLDLAVTNGWFNGPGVSDQSRFFRNTGADPVLFEDVSGAVGFNDTLWGSSLAGADLDGDGDVDLVQTTTNQGPVRVLENIRANKAAAAHWLVIRPRTAGSNRFAIGAEVRAVVGEQTMTRRIAAGGGYLAQEPAEADFGLGDHEFVDRVEITWPSGEATTLFAVPSDQKLTIEKGACCAIADLDFNGVVDASDLTTLLSAWGPCVSVCQGDFNHDGVVNGVDLATLLTGWGPALIK